jgi:hypothetical protein
MSSETDAATGTDAAAGTDAATGTNDAQAPIVDASTLPSPDSGVNGNCSNATFVASDAGTAICRVSRIDGQATIFMDCTPTSCQCYANDTGHPFGAAFSAGQSLCPQSPIAISMMQSQCGCPVQ